MEKTPTENDENESNTNLRYKQTGKKIYKKKRKKKKRKIGMF